MNVPNVYRKALDGFIIPPRTFMQMLVSAGRGAYDLMSPENRVAFIEKLDKGTINEGVISQASAGPLVMLSLFRDLQSPLFKKHGFDAHEFLDGVGPSLARFHNISGALENKLHAIQEEAMAKSEKEAETKKDGSATDEKAEEKVKEATDEILSLFPSFGASDFFPFGDPDKNVAAVLDHYWSDDIRKDPGCLAGQLSRMLTPELFDIHQVSAKTAFLLQNNAKKISFKEGSCKVNNVALLSARAFTCLESKKDDDLESWGDRTKWKYEVVDHELSDFEMNRTKGGVAAQIEVLYDVTQEFVAENRSDSKKDETEANAVDKETKKEDIADLEPENMQTTIVSVAVMEGWLAGGPTGELRWRLALHRPAFEFPGIQQSY